MIVLAAIVLPVLLGLAAIAIDVGYYYDYKQRLGAAADAAALAGAFEIKRNPAISQGSLETYARDDASRNGFTHGVDGVSIDVRHPPTTGLHVGDAKYVEIVISTPRTRFFSKLWSPGNVAVSARAVAGPDEGTGCVYALMSASVKYPVELNVSGGSIRVPNCDVVTNGDLTVSSGDTLIAHGIAVTASSGSITGAYVTPAPTYNSASQPDPFGDLDEAALFGTSWTCGWTGTRRLTNGTGTVTAISGTGQFDASPKNDSSYTMNPGVYCGAPPIKIGLDGPASPKPPGQCIPGTDAMVTFNPGIYILVGTGLDWKHSCVTGTGVVFYFTGTAARPYAACGARMSSTDGPDRFYLSAPTASTTGFKKWDGTTTSPAPYEGLLFVQDRRQGTGGAGAFPAVNCASNPVIGNMLPDYMILDGALYFPNQHLIYGATTVSGGNYTLLITGSVLFQNDARFNSNFTGLAGGSPIKRPGLGE
jgi:hypothetical protein